MRRVFVGGGLRDMRRVVLATVVVGAVSMGGLLVAATPAWAVHRGEFCSAVGATTTGDSGEPLICTRNTPDGRARWEPNGAPPASGGSGVLIREPGEFCSPSQTAVTPQGQPLVCDNVDAQGHMHWVLGSTASSYQPGGCTATTNLGTIGVGQSVSGVLAPGCVYNGQVVMAVNGGAAGTKTPNPGGGVNVNLQATSQSSGLLNDPVQVSIHCGTNAMTATGTTAQGLTATATGTFTLVCNTPTRAAPAAPSSAVAFTGANILRSSLLAGLLIGVGLLTVGVARWRQAE
jgi:hypothetical protein